MRLGNNTGKITNCFALTRVQANVSEAILVVNER